MALHLYRRHKQECKGGHAFRLHTSEFDERKKNWRRCDCPIVAAGSLQKRFNRRSTNQWEWDAARAIASLWEHQGNWDGLIPEAAPQEVPLQPAPRITVDRAITAFTADFQENAAPNTQKKYRLLFDKIKTFAASRGIVSIAQWTPLDIREMRAAWNVAPQTAAKNMSTVKSFFEFCVGNDWLQKNPAKPVKNPRSRDAADRRAEQKLPFTDDELKRMYDACDNAYGKQRIIWSRSIHHKPLSSKLA